MVQPFQGGGGRVQLAIPIETLSFFLSFFLPLRLNPLGTSDGYSGIPSSDRKGGKMSLYSARRSVSLDKTRGWYLGDI